MEQEHHQCIVNDHELVEGQEQEMEDGALKTRQSLSHGTENLTDGVVLASSSSSSSLTSNGSEHSNGVCTAVRDLDGSPVMQEEVFEDIGRVCENNNHVNDDMVDNEAVRLGLAAEVAGAATNGDAISGAAVSHNKNSVYLDKQQDDEVNGLNGVQNGDASGYVYPTNLGEKEFDVQVHQSVIQNSLCREITNECMKTMDDKISSELSHLHNASGIQATAVMNFGEETCAKEGPNLTKEIDQQLQEFDVEAVLAKQETHDLFCPNCNSCITKRVILKKRKRRIHNVDNKAKRDKLETIVSSELVDGSAQPEASQGDRTDVTSDIVTVEPPADDNYHPDRDPEVFRCLSCFSFFIPSGNCFNLFRGASKNEGTQNPSNIPSSNLQDPSNLPGSNANWLKSQLITWTKGKKASDASLEHSRTDPAEQHPSTSISSNVPTSSEIGHPEGLLTNTSIIKNVKPTPDINNGHGEMNSLISSTNGLSTIQSYTKSAGDAMNGMPIIGQDFTDKAKEQLLAGNLMTNEGEEKRASVDIIKTNIDVMSSVSFSDEKVSKHEIVQIAAAATTETLVSFGEIAKDAILNPNAGGPELLGSTAVGKIPEAVKNTYSSLGQGAQSTIQSFGSAIIASDVATIKQNAGMDAILPSKLDFKVIEKLQKDSDKEINPSTRKENEGGDVIVDVEKEPFESTSQTADNIPVEGVTESHTQAQIVEEPRDEAGEPQGWEVLKSIVYGGLTESITSLGIVSSAISSGATPLNIIALGFANIIGGLFILGHNLIDLKNDHSEGDQMQMIVQNRYQELLGRRANFLLHAVVAVLSFLIFGSVPLVIYGLLINKNYYAEVKLAVVAATSVVCIILLAIGKVYTTRPPKSYIKTVSYFVTLALAASGVSYIGGNLIKDLLEKLNHSESGLTITMPISDARAWMSY
ncbi:membrane protein of ER body-like protein [Abrus precatorius]|uniref:Membrane protein of ER body-like protein n=1 Tax=Abrus precatorius TaxID=3816 RepID=A0A8B8JMJ1_ABRPR|nr:membrane protein of ER body-like protein [Abrus precatorius]